MKMTILTAIRNNLNINISGRVWTHTEQTSIQTLSCLTLDKSPSYSKHQFVCKLKIHLCFYFKVWRGNEMSLQHTCMLGRCPTLCDPIVCSQLDSPLSMGFSGKDYWVGCHLQLQGSSRPQD